VTEYSKQLYRTRDVGDDDGGGGGGGGGGDGGDNDGGLESTPSH